MKLINARLCCNCEWVYDEFDGDTCPKCTSKHFLSIAKVLNRGKS